MDTPKIFTGRRRAVLAAVLSLAAVGTASYQAGLHAGKAKTMRVADYAVLRAPAVGYQAGQVDGGFVLVAGDSHAELAMPEAGRCGWAFVNAGVSGAKTDGYARFLEKVSMPRRASVAVVTLGTNDLLRKYEPAGKAAADAYEEALSRVVGTLRKHAERVIVAAVPPVPAASAGLVDPAGVGNLTKRQAAVCARLGCETADPYAGYRGASFDEARAGASRDGLHMTDYRPAYRAIDDLICKP